MQNIGETDCCIVGSGPAGAVLALLLARQGVGVTLLEAHGDFNRQFRGDTIHPSTLELMEQLGLRDGLLRIPHTRHETLTLRTPRGVRPYLDFRGLHTAYPYVLRLPQPRFLEFVTAEASRYPGFRLVMSARVEALLEDDGPIRGVGYRGPGGWHKMRANLVVGADGRFSRVRELARLPSTKAAQPIDILWFQLPSRPGDPVTDGGLHVGAGGINFIRNRGQFWQIACLLPKGAYQRVRAAGLEAVRGAVAATIPWLDDRTSLLTSWSQTSLLVVESSRALQWHRPGLLLIGDAAHVMSPVGGVGINLAIQDAVAASNLLGSRLRQGTVRSPDLGAVQRRREWPTRLIQALQDLFLQHVLGDRVAASSQAWVGRAAEQVPFLRAVRTRLFAFGGFWPERVLE
ncbi:MAG TPA: FAD-dependent oxidoreductase [Ktedonobacterales bacterium]|nr:FAD-dependent oxidoreductase [Ktedonobacterales bacterium]